MEKKILLMSMHISIVLELKKSGIGGGNRKIGGFTSKIHVATDENGKVMGIFITGGNIHDST